MQIFELARQRHLLRVHVGEHRAQQVAEARQRLLGLLALLLAHQHHDGVQRVEQEVRLQLRLERAEARLRHLGLELRGAQVRAQRRLRAFLESRVVADRRSGW